MARRLWWHVLSIGRAWRDERELHEAGDKSGLFLFWVISGSGAFESGRERWSLAKGPRCWLVDMARSRTYLPAKSRRLVTTGLRFSGPGLDAWRELLKPGEVTFAFPSGMSAITSLHSKLVRIVKRRPAGYEWQVHEMLTRLIGHLLGARQALPIYTPAPALPVARVLEAVLKNPSRAWRAAELADIGGVSYSGLRSLFRATQQESLSDFLQRTRLDQARLLLADDRLAIKEVARRLAFSSEFYFSQWFRRQTRRSPSSFRDTLRR